MGHVVEQHPTFDSLERKQDKYRQLAAQMISHISAAAAGNETEFQLGIVTVTHQLQASLGMSLSTTLLKEELFKESHPCS